jgi:hypothetical protein
MSLTVIRVSPADIGLSRPLDCGLYLGVSDEGVPCISWEAGAARGRVGLAVLWPAPHAPIRFDLGYIPSGEVCVVCLARATDQEVAAPLSPEVQLIYTDC